MHAWIGFYFSCAMIIMAAAGKSGYQVLPGSIGGSSSSEFMFYIGCAGFAAALAMLAPNHSSARLASVWSASALAVVVIALNLNGLSGNSQERMIESETAIQLGQSVKNPAAAEKPQINVVLKRTITDKDWQPFEDIDYRVRMMERAMPAQPESSEANPQNIPLTE